MANYFLYYGITPTKKLVICLYHNDFAAKLAYMLLSENKSMNGSTKKTGGLPETSSEVSHFIMHELFMIQQSLSEEKKSPLLTGVVYSGDVNLGFGGFAESNSFPKCLFDSSIHKLFRENPLFTHVPVFFYLESYNVEIAQKAADIYSKNYAQNHAENYPNSPLIIQLKGSKIPFYCTTNNSPLKTQVIPKENGSPQFDKTLSPRNSPLPSAKNSHRFSPAHSPNVKKRSEEGLESRNIKAYYLPLNPSS
jgi:hypothetical protein